MKFYIYIALLFFSVSSFSQTFEGRVVSAINSTKNIPFAKISFIDLGETISCDSSGYWTNDNIPKGINHIHVTAVGYELLEMDVNFEGTGMYFFYMEPAHHQFDKVIVSNDGILQRESITNIESHTMTQLNKIPSTTLGEVLTNIPGVYQAGTGTGISKPVIRGLSGSSVVTYVNSLRIENQQWGGDHGLPITSLGIGSVEVIKGPSSLLYGPDAMGGVLYFVDEAYVQKNTMNGCVQSRFDHNSLGTSNQAGIKFSKNSMHLNAYGSYDNNADFGIPNGKQILNSRYAQSSAKVAFGYNKKKWVFNLRYNFYNGRIGLPGHTHDSIVSPETFQTLNQNRAENVPQQKIQNHFVSIENKFFLKNQDIFLTIGNTNNSLKEHEEKFFFPDIIMNLNNSLFNLKWKRKLGSYWTSTLGSQGMFQVNTNGKSATEILIPNAQTQDIGGYGLLNFSKQKWRLLFGARYDARKIITQDDNLPFSNIYSGLNYSTGFSRISKNTTLRFSVSSGFRAPTTSELLSDGIHHGSFRYEIGNQNLKTEKAMQIDFSYAFHFEDLEISINPFYNRINDFTYLEQTDSTIDGFNVFNYAQADFAQLYGIDFGFHFHPHFAHWMHIESSFSTIFAEDNFKNPLPFIPQTRINSQLKFEFKSKRKFHIEDAVVQHIFNFKQNRLGNLETESPYYQVINASLNFKLEGENEFFLSIGARNLTNTTFIDHLSGLKNLGLPAPAINVFCSLKYEFNKQLK